LIVASVLLLLIAAGGFALYKSRSQPTGAAISTSADSGRQLRDSESAPAADSGPSRLAARDASLPRVALAADLGLDAAPTVVKTPLLPKSTKAKVSVRFGSTPAGALIVIGGRRAGSTPLTMTYAQNRRRQIVATLTKPGYVAARRRIDLANNRTVHVDLVKKKTSAEDLRPDELKPVGR
jgi:hypothetical protein